VPCLLIVNADDFGHSEGVDAGVIEAHERGIVTSTSMLVLRPHAEAAAEYARGAKLELGLHIELGEWEFDEAAGWSARYEIPTDDVRSEVQRQLARFELLVGRKPTHLDSHQHVHRDEPARSALRQLADELGVPLRHFTPGIGYCGDFYGQDEEGRPFPSNVSAEALVAVVRSLPEGATELCCHPGRGEIADSSYAHERELELEALCDASVRDVLKSEGIELTRFADLPRSYLNE
jgi:chitin disaccharide deacetylase